MKTTLLPRDVHSLLLLALNPLTPETGKVIALLSPEVKDLGRVILTVMKSAPGSPEYLQMKREVPDEGIWNAAKEFQRIAKGRQNEGLLSERQRDMTPA